MENEQSEAKRVTAEEAFREVGRLLGHLDARLDRHGERLANNDETLKAMADFISVLREAVIDLQRRAGLQTVGSKQAN